MSFAEHAQLKNIQCQLCIVGAGPAGFSAAIQANRDGLDFTWISDDDLGGLARAARSIENLPGYSFGISGLALAKIFEHHRDKCKINLLRGHVQSIEQVGQGYVLSREKAEQIRAKTVIVATGTQPRAFTLVGPESWAQTKKIHRDIRSLPKDISGQNFLVIGGGDAAFDSALSLLERSAQVRILINQVNPRLCRGDSQSLTFPGTTGSTPFCEPLKDHKEGGSSGVQEFESYEVAMQVPHCVHSKIPKEGFISRVACVFI